MIHDPRSEMLFEERENTCKTHDIKADVERRERFLKQTEEALHRCASYLDVHARAFAEEFAGGCKSWFVKFSAGDDGMFFCVEVLRGHENFDVIDSYKSGPLTSYASSDADADA